MFANAEMGSNLSTRTTSGPPASSSHMEAQQQPTSTCRAPDSSTMASSNPIGLISRAARARRRHGHGCLIDPATGYPIDHAHHGPISLPDLPDELFPPAIPPTMDQADARFLCGHAVPREPFSTADTAHRHKVLQSNQALLNILANAPEGQKKNKTLGKLRQTPYILAQSLSARPCPSCTNILRTSDGALSAELILGRDVMKRLGSEVVRALVGKGLKNPAQRAEEQTVRDVNRLQALERAETRVVNGIYRSVGTAEEVEVQHDDFAGTEEVNTYAVVEKLNYAHETAGRVWLVLESDGVVKTVDGYGYADHGDQTVVQPDCCVDTSTKSPRDEHENAQPPVVDLIEAPRSTGQEQLVYTTRVGLHEAFRGVLPEAQILKNRILHVVETSLTSRRVHCHR